MSATQFYFFDDLLLLIALPGVLVLDFILKRVDSLVLCTETKPQQLFFTPKKIFFVQLRVAQVILWIVLLFSLLLGMSLLVDNTIADSILLHTGNYFFRKDKVILFSNIIVTFSGLYYLYLTAFVFTRSIPTMKYVCELPFLVMTTVTALRLFLSTNDLMLLALFVEISAFCSIILIGVQSVSPSSLIFPVEAAIKYFFINAVAIVFLLFAIGFYFSCANTINILDLIALFQKHPYLIVFSGEHLIFAQLLFFFAYFIKIGTAPVHQWVPDVYEGAESIITAFLVIIISPILVVKLILLFKQMTAIPVSISLLQSFFHFCGISSIIIGTLNAFYQTKIKRFIAYAGLTHLGFILIALACNDILGYFAAAAYLLVYYCTNICFFTLLLLGHYQLKAATTSLVYIHQLRPLFQRSSFFFYAFVIVLLSFAGVPPFAGFFVKFFVLAAAVNYIAFPLVLIMVISIIVGTFMYLRFLKVALFEQAVQPKYHVGIQSKTQTQINYYVLWQKPGIPFQPVNLSLWDQTLLIKFMLLLAFILAFMVFLPVFGLSLVNLIIIFVATY